MATDIDSAKKRLATTCIEICKEIKRDHTSGRLAQILADSVVASIGHKEKLLTSTLETYFQGRKDLSKGLAMERLPYWFGSGAPTYLSRY